MVDVNIVIISGRDVDDLKAKVTDFDFVIVVVVVADAAVVLVILAPVFGIIVVVVADAAQGRINHKAD